jgi:hypothetical protein
MASSAARRLKSCRSSVTWIETRRGSTRLAQQCADRAGRGRRQRRVGGTGQ